MPCENASARQRNRNARADVAQALWLGARDRAARKGVPFTLSVEDVRAVWPADGRCPALGIPLARGTGRVRPGSPTLDRLIPDWGYASGNVAVISHAANLAKSARTARELEAVAAWMRRAGLD